MEMEQEKFNVLENKAIGRNIALYRKIRGVKASDIAERLGIKESSYTRYERGETAITVDVVQQIAEVLSVDPLILLSIHPSFFLENGNNSPNACNGNHGYYNYQTVNEQQTQMMLKLMDNVLAISEKLMAILDKQK
jgi:transcriptional regulator with XRE-family HTH domain